MRDGGGEGCVGKMQDGRGVGVRCRMGGVWGTVLTSAIGAVIDTLLYHVNKI